MPEAGAVTAYYRQLGRASASFALLAEAALVTLGGSLKRREMLSARLGDVLSELYMASCALKRFEDDGRPEEDRPLLDWCCRSALFAVDQRTDEILANFPARPLAWALRRVLLPYGPRQRPPGDQLARRCAELLLAPSAARDRLTAGIYVGAPEDNLGRLERALEAALAAEAVEDKLNGVVDRNALRERDPQALREAVHGGAVTEAELRRLEEFDRLRGEVIAVDDFAPEDLRQGEPRWREQPASVARSMS